MTDEAANPAREGVTMAACLAMNPSDRLVWTVESPGYLTSVRDRTRIFLMFARPRVCVAGGLAFYIAWVYAGQSASPQMVVGIVIAFLLNAIANLFNIYTDVVEDNENIPVRLYFLGLYGRRKLLIDTYVLCAAMLVAALAVSFPFFVAVICGIIGTHQYSFPPFRMKARPILGIGLFAMALTYPYITVLTMVNNGFELLTDRTFVAPVIYLFFWLCCTVVLINNVTDYYGDRRAQVQTSATLASTRNRAAVVAAVASIVVYLAYPVMVLVGGLPLRVLWALVWFPPVVWVCVQMIRRDDAKSANDTLRDNVVISHGFIATFTLLSDFSLVSVAIVAAGAIVIFLSDVFKLDTRRPEDIASSLD